MKKQYISPVSKVIHTCLLHIIATSGEGPELSTGGYSDPEQEGLVKSQNSLWDNDWD